MMSKTLKHSKQREALIRILKDTKSHPSADWIYSELKKEFPNISLATVYRNLNLLLETNQIIKLDIGTGTEHYDACCDIHYHLVCNACNSVVDLSIPPLSDIEKTAEENDNVSINSHSLIFYGMCSECNKSA